MIGTFKAARTNDYGYTSICVDDVWYSVDTKGFTPTAAKGDRVEFDTYEKPGNNGKVYTQYRSASFKVLGKEADAAPVKVAGFGTVKSSNAADDEWSF